VSSRSRSLVLFFGLVGYLVLVKLALILLPQALRSPAQAAVFGWPWLAAWAALGSLGVWLSERTGFPPAWEAGALRPKLIEPAVWGLGFGALALGTDAATGWAAAVAARMGLDSIHIPFPASVLVYPGGAVIVEILYRLFPIPAILWLLSKVGVRGERQETAFWVLAILTSFVEPLGDLGLRQQGLATMIVVFAQDYALNFAQAAFFRKRGFLAAIVVRVAFYVLWHMVPSVTHSLGISR
jgi:hypothetical protein